MKLVLISDTHNCHEYLEIPQCDVLIHSGDFTNRGRVHEVVDFLLWFEKQPATYKIFVAGNHDVFCEKESAELGRMLRQYKCSYLRDSSITVMGKLVHGSPVTPTFHNLAFNKDRGPQIQQHWDLIPNNADILITHGPPVTIGDRNSDYMPVGCYDLHNRVKAVNPLLHVFGHVHEGRGEYNSEGLRTRFVNASSISPDHRYIYPPIEIEL